MTEILGKLDGGELLGLCGIVLGLMGIVGGITVAITKVVAAHYRRTQLDEMEATLKMEMIQRGMSAVEIKQVLEARMGSSRPSTLGEFFGSLPSVQMPNLFAKDAKKG
jgi:hypothetical protein